MERQNSVEFLDTVVDKEEAEEKSVSTPDISKEHTAKKEKKKKHFHVFHKKNHKERKGTILDNHRNERSDSLPTQTQIRLPQEHLSLESSWSHGMWTPSLEQQYRTNSPAHSSMNSLLSVESDLRSAVSDEEIVESLINPPRKESFRASVSPPVSVSTS